MEMLPERVANILNEGLDRSQLSWGLLIRVVHFVNSNAKGECVCCYFKSFWRNLRGYAHLKSGIDANRVLSGTQRVLQTEVNLDTDGSVGCRDGKVRHLTGISCYLKVDLGCSGAEYRSKAIKDSVDCVLLNPWMHQLKVACA